MSGRVVDAATRLPLPDARVTACLVDRRPSGNADSEGGFDCIDAPVDSAGRFRVAGSRRWVLALPFPEGVPAYSTNLRVEAPGHEARDLYWHRDARLLEREMVLIELRSIASRP